MLITVDFSEDFLNLSADPDTLYLYCIKNDGWVMGDEIQPKKILFYGITPSRVIRFQAAALETEIPENIGNLVPNFNDLAFKQFKSISFKDGELKLKHLDN